MKTATVVLIFAFLALSAFSWETEDIEIDDIDQANCDDHCAVCQGNTTCTKCKDGYYLTPISTECQACNSKIQHCSRCTYTNSTSNEAVTCDACISGYDLKDNKCEQEQQSSSTAIIIVSIVGGVVLIGAGIAVWRCIKNKKKKASTLLDQGEELEE